MAKKVDVTIEGKKDGFGCYSTTCIGDVCAIVGDGKTVKEAKDDFLAAVQEQREAYPDDRNFDDLEFVYHYDIRSFFEYFSFLNVSEVARRAGISSSTMRQYTGGLRHASESTYSKLAACMEDIKKELSAASF